MANIQKKQTRGAFYRLNEKELIARIKQYFLSCTENTQKVLVMGNVREVNMPKIPTIAGLALYLGIDRDTLFAYSEKDIFGDVIAEAKNRIYAAWEEIAVNPIHRNVQGLMFVMKNYGYTDRKEITVKETPKLVIEDYGRGIEEADYEEI